MPLEVVFFGEALVAELALEVLLLGVRLDVPLEAHVLLEDLPAEVAGELAVHARLLPLDRRRIRGDRNGHRSTIEQMCADVTAE